MAEKQNTPEPTYEIQEEKAKPKFREILNRRPVKIATFTVAGALALGAAFGVGAAVGHLDGPRHGGNFSQFGGPMGGHGFGDADGDHQPPMGANGQLPPRGDGDGDHGFQAPNGQQGPGQVAPNGVTPTAPTATTAP